MVPPPTANDTDPNGRNFAFATVLTEDYVPGFAVLIHTLRKHNPGFAFPFHIFHGGANPALSDESQALISSLYPNARVTAIDERNYQKLGGSKRANAELLFLEAFLLSDYSRVVLLHSDLLCLGRIDELCTNRADLACVPRQNGELSTAVLTIGAKLLGEETYRCLLTHRASGKLILPEFFRDASRHAHSRLHNTSKRVFPDSRIEVIEEVIAMGTTLLHFEGVKPWQPHTSLEESRYHILESYWRDELIEALQPLANKFPIASTIFERAMSRVATGLSRRSELDLRERIRALEKRAEAAEQKLRLAAGVLRRAAGPSSVSPEPPPELIQEMEHLREECDGFRKRYTILEKENAAYSRALRLGDENQRKLKASLEKARKCEAGHKVLRKTHDTLVAYTLKVAERLERLTGNPFLWLLHKRFRHWAFNLRRLTEERAKVAAPGKEAKPAEKERLS